MFRTKICGVTSTLDACQAAEAGADAIGLNFYARSPRFVSPELAQTIAKALPPEVAKVGVFVNSTVDEVQKLALDVPLDYVQLHGDEPPDFLAQLAGFAVIRAFRVPPDGWTQVSNYLIRCGELGCLPVAILLDAYHPQAYGGTGERVDWAALVAWREITALFKPLPPIILAGGLTAENIAAAIRTVRPAAVDTASGVESAPGKKDHARVSAFLHAAQLAWD